MSEPHISATEPHGGQVLATEPHGGQVFRAAQILGCSADSICDLSASLNPFAPDTSELLAQLSSHSRFYPDTESATGLLASAIGVEADRVVLTNGASEAIALVAQLFPHGQLEPPTFSLYSRHLKTTTATASLSDSDQKVMSWRCNPTSPLGRLYGTEIRSDIWDESFYPLATGSWSRPEQTCWKIGSLTKLWACPGLRLGYVIAPSSADAYALKAIQPRWSVNSLALAAIGPLLEQTELEKWATQIRSERRKLVDDLESFGLKVTLTEANWVIVDADEQFIDRLFRHRVLVRDLTSFGLVGKARIAVGTEAERNQLLSALEIVC